MIKKKMSISAMKERNVTFTNLVSKIKYIRYSRERDIYESRHQDRRCHLYWDRSWDLGMISLAEWRVCNKSIRLLCPVMASEERLRTSPRWSPRIHRSNACKGRGPTERRPAGIFLALKHIRFEIDFLKTRGKKKKERGKKRRIIHN